MRTNLAKRSTSRLVEWLATERVELDDAVACWVLDPNNGSKHAATLDELVDVHYVLTKLTRYCGPETASMIYAERATADDEFGYEDRTPVTSAMLFLNVSIETVVDYLSAERQLRAKTQRSTIDQDWLAFALDECFCWLRALRLALGVSAAAVASYTAFKTYQREVKKVKDKKAEVRMAQLSLEAFPN